MLSLVKKLIQKTYEAYNDCDMDGLLETLHPGVRWPKLFESGYLRGHAALRSYLTNQWNENKVSFAPLKFGTNPDGNFLVTVHQRAEDNSGTVLFDKTVTHIITISDDVLLRLDIEPYQRNGYLAGPNL